MKIQLLIDNPNSWIVPFAEQWVIKINKWNHLVTIKHDHKDVEEGDILILLSCERKFLQLYLNKHNLVVHESDLPHGKGWSPLTWQILEGKQQIPVTLFEATECFDDGPIYNQIMIEFSGDELIEELREKQALTTFRLIESFIDKYPDIEVITQKGEETFYPKRKHKDSELDINKTIAEQFNLLRICDNDRYPAHFYFHGKKFLLKIFKAE